MMNLQRYSESVKEILLHAKDEAEKLRNEYIDEDHILLAILKTEDAQVDRILGQSGLSREELLKSLELTLKSGKHILTCGDLPFSPSAKNALEHACKEAEILNSALVKLEHLLLGLLRRKKGGPP